MYFAEYVHDKRSNIGKYEALLAFLCVLSFVLKSALINQDISILLNKFLADDAFYYYSLSKNIINGHGIVFNYGIPTNGFHPFYVLILLIIYKFAYPFGINAPIYISLYMMSLLNITTAIFAYLILSEIHSKEAGLLGAFVWLFNPFVIFVYFMGLETPIQIFFISVLTYFMVIKRHMTHLTTRDSVVTGALIGFIFLSRMDGIFIGIGVIGALTIRKIFIKNTISINNVREFVKSISDLITICLTAFLIVFPWIAWNLIELDRLTPISGEALRTMRLNSASYSSLVVSSVLWSGSFITKYFIYSADDLLEGILVIVAALAIPITILVIKKDTTVKKLVMYLDFFIISSIIYYPFYWFYELGFRDWYSLYTTFMITIIFSTVIIELIQICTPKRYRNVIALSLICMLAISFISGGIMSYEEGNYPEEKLKWQIANYIDEDMPVNMTLGSFNTGIYQYYTEDHDVINLDGVMNPKACQAMKEGLIETYIIENEIDYIVDPESIVSMINSSIILLQPVKTFTMDYCHDERWRTANYKIFEIISCEDWPTEPI